MRLIYTIGLVAAVILSASSAALLAEDFKGTKKNAASFSIIDLKNTGGERRLRHVDYDDLDDGGMEEERGFDIKKVASKLNPVTAAKKSAAQIAKAKEALKDAADYQKMIDTANRIVRGLDN